MNNKLRLYYVTDPICSHCWAIEPVLRRFLAEYGQHFSVRIVMGCLLEEWGDGPIDPANGIYTPSDVVPHWREVGAEARMPIDASLMIDDPVQSSYPPSRVFKVIQEKYGDQTAAKFLRLVRVSLFVFNKNISRTAVLIDLVNQLSLDGNYIVQIAEQQKGQKLLEEDFQLGRSLGVRAFPTIIMLNSEGQGVRIVGARPLNRYVSALKQVLQTESLGRQTLPPLSRMLQEAGLLFSKEIEVMYDLSRAEVDNFVSRQLAPESFRATEFRGERYFTPVPQS